MTDRRKMKKRVEERSEDPPSSDSYSEMDEGFVLVNENVQEVRWDGHQFDYYRIKPTRYQVTMMNAREAWANLSIETVQQAVGAAALELTSKASELTNAATATITMESVQHSVGTIASGVATIASKVAYEAVSRVPGLITPMYSSFEEDKTTATNRDTSPRRKMMIAQQTQIGHRNWEAPMNAVRQGNEEKSKAMQVDEWLNKVPKEHHSGEYGPTFTRNEYHYDTLGVSNAWERPGRELIRGDRKNVLLEQWKQRENRSARDGADKKRSAGIGAQPSRIPVKVTKCPKTLPDADWEDKTEQALQDPTPDATNKAMIANIDIADQEER